MYDLYLIVYTLFFLIIQAVEETNSSSTSNLISHANCDDVVPCSTSQVRENILSSSAGKLRHRSRSSTIHRSGSFSDDQARPRISPRAVKSVSLNCDTAWFESAGDVSSLQTSLSALRQHCCLEGTKHNAESSHYVEKVLRAECHDTLLFPDFTCLTPQSASFRHSTPEDRNSATASHTISQNACESMCSSRDDCPYEDIDTSAAVRNTLSWHDSVNFEPSSSRSCVSLDDSLFLRNFNVEGSNEAEVLATCTAVSSLEQLEQEVAGVLSDCGDMERCFGVLRQSENVKAVIGRYSLGVADCVLAADKCARWQESMDSPIVDELSLSSSIGVVRHSGFLWDDDGFDAYSPSVGIVPVTRRATRSLSPLPAIVRQQANSRASFGTYIDSRVNGNGINWTDVDNNTSVDVAPCSVYDVNRRLSGRPLLTQHVSD